MKNFQQLLGQTLNCIHLAELAMNTELPLDDKVKAPVQAHVLRDLLQQAPSRRCLSNVASLLAVAQANQHEQRALVDLYFVRLQTFEAQANPL